MAWWDGNANEQRTRTLWSWGLDEGRNRRRDPNSEPMSRHARRERGRLLAETFEGVSTASDQAGSGGGPFGTLRTGSWKLLLQRKLGEKTSQERYAERRGRR
jgi:hypothetical protein